MTLIEAVETKRAQRALYAAAVEADAVVAKWVAIEAAAGAVVFTADAAAISAKVIKAKDAAAAHWAAYALATAK